LFKFALYSSLICSAFNNFKCFFNSFAVNSSGSTPYICNNSFVVISGQRVVSPYTIKAIGNQTYLESALITKNGYVDTLKASEKSVTIEKSKNVAINKYNGEIELKYVTSK